MARPSIPIRMFAAICVTVLLAASTLANKRPPPDISDLVGNWELNYIRSFLKKPKNTEPDRLAVTLSGSTIEFHFKINGTIDVPRTYIVDGNEHFESETGNLNGTLYSHIYYTAVWEGGTDDVLSLHLRATNEISDAPLVGGSEGVRARDTWNLSPNRRVLVDTFNIDKKYFQRIYDKR